VSLLSLSCLVRCCGALPHKILVEPSDRAPDRVNLVLSFHEAVTFIGMLVNVHRPAFFLKDIDDLLRLLLRHARIVVALEHQQRRLLASNVCDRRIGIVHPVMLIFLGST
jgi:hypothetical protein